MRALQIDEDPEFERRSWIVQRAGWIAFASFLAAAAAGLLGSGPLSHARAEAPDGSLVILYERTARAERPIEMVCRVGAQATRGELVQLWIDQAWLADVRIEGTMPEPEAVLAASDRQMFEFRAAGRGEPAEIRFHLEPQRAGRLRGRAGTVGGAQVDFAQFVFP